MDAEKSGSPAEETDDVTAAWFTVDEETTMELSKLLESFCHAPPPFKVRFVDDPYSSAVVFQSSSAYVTVNEESCGGPSFSDSESSMASINLGGAIRFIGGGAWSFTSDEARECAGVDLNDFLMDESGFDGDDDPWKEFLGGGNIGFGVQS